MLRYGLDSPGVLVTSTNIYLINVAQNLAVSADCKRWREQSCNEAEVE